MTRYWSSWLGAKTAAASIGPLLAGTLLLYGLRDWPGDTATRTVVGNTAPPYAAITLEGDSVDLADFRGRPVLLNIWATWCGPCREEMPSIQRLYETFQAEGLAVIAVSVDAAPPGFYRENYEARTVMTFLKAYGLGLPIWLDPAGRVKEVFRTMGVPTTILMDRDGTVDNIVVGSVDWDEGFYRELVLDILASESGVGMSERARGETEGAVLVDRSPTRPRH